MPTQDNQKLGNLTFAAVVLMSSWDEGKYKPEPLEESIAFLRKTFDDEATGSELIAAATKYCKAATENYSSPKAVPSNIQCETTCLLLALLDADPAALTTGTWKCSKSMVKENRETLLNLADEI